MKAQSQLGGSFNMTYFSEAVLRDRDVTLRLSVHGGASWSAAARRGEINGLSMSLDPGVSLRPLRVASVAPTDLLLYIERHRTFDISSDTPLMLRVTHMCSGSALTGVRLPPCAETAEGVLCGLAQRCPS